MPLQPNRSKPELEVPGDQPPTELVVEDLIDGTGDEARAGHTVSAHYAGWAFSSGEEFDSSWGRGAPLDFPLGAGRVTRGGTRASRA